MARPRRFVRSKKGTMLWLQAAPNSTPQPVGAASAVLLSTLNAAALALRPFTILRQRGILAWQSDQAGATEDPHGIFGSIVVTDTASGVGITAIPDPLTDPDASWVVFQPLFTRFRFVSAAGIFENPGEGSTYTYDSKSMRKVGNNDDLVTVAVNGSSFGAEILQVGRTLVKLH